MKICNICELEKDDNEFRKRHNQCKKCVYQKERQTMNEESLKNLYCIYRLFIADITIYIGKYRNIGRKKDIQTIKKIAILKMDIVIISIASIMEDLIMKLYRGIGNCNLWKEIGGVYHKKKVKKNIVKVRKG